MIAFHLEPYPGRSAESVRQDVMYILDKFAGHPALLRAPSKRQPHMDALPVFYVYDSYHIHPSQWATILGEDVPSGLRSAEGGKYNGLFIGLWLDRTHGDGT